MKEHKRLKSGVGGLTSVDYRKEQLKERLERSESLINGKEEMKIGVTGEEGVNQMRAILGLCELVTNVNLPNIGQIPNLPLGAVVETNAVFNSGSVVPVFSREVPPEIYPLVSRICSEQEEISEAVAERNLDRIFNAFVNNPLTTCTYSEAKTLFDKKVENTKEYLIMYNI